MADMHHYTNAISQIVSTPTDEDVVIRGHRLSDLIQNASFAEAVFLMLAGHMPRSGLKNRWCRAGSHLCAIQGTKSVV